ncbi:unnamed protein product [Fusarium equiseti]|uniref:RelA/SpoT domain-containing protein n=1 Tax=Fusarium equiseti TaxID=61235 RepID=A0A8J2NB08_FUSEQ|nr:unnamed protein product [Fusarium equiseti]
MSPERGCSHVENSTQSSSLRNRISELVDKKIGDPDPKDTFIQYVWSEVEDEYQKMADELATVCKEELTRRDVPAAVESRVKSRASIAKSLDRREIYRQKRDEGLYKDIHEILHDLHDLVGIRIIVDYLDHLEAVSEFVTGTFHQERDPNIFSASRKVGQSWDTWFGAYECKNHHVSAKYTEDISLSYYNAVIFEIQITSLPANLYNKIAHPLLYKGEAGELSQGDEIIIDLTKGLAFCYSLCTYYKKHKLEGKAIDTYEMELMQKVSSASEGPEFESSIDRLAERIPGVAGTDTKGKFVPRETFELVLKSLLNQDIPNNIGQCLVDELRREIQDIGRPRIELPSFGKARFDSQDVFQSPVCQEGTQTRAIEYIHNWVGYGKEPLLWICSHAGSGKSTLARTIARDLIESGQIAAGYFFRRGDVGRNHISHVIPTVAAQLLCTIPHFEPCLRASVDASKNVDFETMRLDEQFKVLLKTPLSQVGHIPSTKVIIIDALDECVDLVQVDKLIDLLVNLKTLSMVQICLLVTSRDEDPIRAAIVRQAHEKLLLATTYHDDNITDIESILRVGFQRIRKEAGIEPTWPTEEQFREVVHRSTNPSPLFIYATTLLRFLGDGTRLRVPKKRLNNWIEKRAGTTFTTQLDEMYTTVFENLDPDIGHGSSENLMEDEKDGLRTVLGAIALAVEPLSINSLSDILGIDLDILDLLRSCRAVLYIPESNDDPVQMLHKSFSDFLLRRLTKETCWFKVDERQQNELLAQGCITHLEGRLKNNICELQDHALLRYASSYWVQHVRKAGDISLLGGVVESFLYTRFLEWVECMAILGRLDSASSAIEELRANTLADNDLGRFLYDAYRFLLKHSPIIEKAPRQTFGSALLFSPTKSIIRNNFWGRRLPECQNVRNLPEHWDSVLQQICLSPDRIDVDAIALSPDGKLLASSHTNHGITHYPKFYIELWQSVTGAHLARAKVPSQVIAMCWAKHEENLIFVTGSGQVYRHDFLQEDPVAITPHRFKIFPVKLAAISPAGVVAMAHSTDSGMSLPKYAKDCQVYLWDAIEGRSLMKWSSMVRLSAIAISHDSCQVAIVTEGKVKVGNTATGSLLDLAKSNSDTSLAFSADANRLFVLDREFLTVISIHEGSLRTVPVLQNRLYSALVVFPDEAIVATLWVYDLWLWSIEDNNPHHSETTTDYIRDVCLDGALSASMPIEASSYATGIAMSPDGQYLASLLDNRIYLWLLPGGTLYKLLTTKDPPPYPFMWQFTDFLSFSRDGSLVLTACNSSVYVWTLEQNQSSEVELPTTAIIPFKRSYIWRGDSPFEISIVWMTGNKVAIFSFSTLEIWNIQDKAYCLQTFETPHRDRISTFAFAPESDLLVIAYNCTLTVLPPGKDASRQDIKTNFSVTAMSFSPDGSMLLFSGPGGGRSEDDSPTDDVIWASLVYSGTRPSSHGEGLESSDVFILD